MSTPTGTDRSSQAEPGSSQDCAALPAAADFDGARCRALLSVLTSVVWLTDTEGRFTQPQPPWTAYTGQDWKAQRGHGWTHAVHPEDIARVGEALKQARTHGQPYVVGGRLWHAPSHRYRHVEVRGVPVRDDGGEVVEWVGTCRDVDEQKRAEDALVEMDRRKDDFIAVLAHELRNPLAPIRNAVQVLKMRGNADMQLSWARNIIERQVTQMAHLLDDLLDVSRIARNKIELQKSRVTLDSILDAAVESSRPHWEMNGVQFELTVLSGPIYVEADPLRLSQVFTNILNNAAKYTDSGGRITLTVRREGNEAVVRVEDTGIGISPEMLPRLFELFSQDRPALERSQGGLGIGLSIAHALVHMHGGRIEAESAGPGRGSAFTVRLAVTGARSQDTGPPAPRHDPGTLRVLVADDNRDAAETLQVLLEMLGHDVVLALDGEEALAKARSFHPEIALLDIGMPKRNGYEVAQALSHHESRPYLVALTGWGQPEDIRRAHAAGFDRHLVKPVQIDQLMEILAARAAQREEP